ncbi:MAG: hypothetical protein R2753_04040 [Chitinophagales bacterium]
MKNSFTVYSLLFLLFVGASSFLVNAYINDAKKLKNIKTQEVQEYFHSKPTELISCTDGTCGLPVTEKTNRANVTFILGEDNNLDNIYYTAAEQYYRNHPQTKNDLLVTHCRSIQEVMDYLKTNVDHEAWGQINLVVHSNEWMGLGTSIFPEGKRTTVANLSEAIKNKTLQSLSDDIVDGETEIMVYGCAFGKNELLMQKIAEAFGGKDEASPTVRSSKYFISYTLINESTNKYLTEYYYTYYKTGYRPGDIKLAYQLKKNFPSAEVDFRDALSRTQPRFAGDSYHYYFNVPLQWIITFPTIEERPKVETTEEQMAFLNEQSELLATIKSLNIPIDKFRWQFRNVNYTFEDGVTEPAIVIQGKSSVLCVLKAITEENSDKPLVPNKNDKQYFTTVRAF